MPALDVCTITGSANVPQSGAVAAADDAFIQVHRASRSGINLVILPFTVSPSSGSFTIVVPRNCIIYVSGNVDGLWKDADGNYYTEANPKALTVPDAATASLESLVAVTTVPAEGITVKSNGSAFASLIGILDFSSAFALTESPTGELNIGLAGAGILSLNGLVEGAQEFAAGSSGNDFNIASADDTHTFNLPTASATKRGALSSADWSTFNGKQAALGFTPEDVARKATDFATVNNTLYPTVAAVKAYADALVVGLVDDRGNFDASGNAFPSSGGSGTAGAILKGDLWLISVAGTLGGVAVAIGDQVRALADTPGQTASNWAISEANIGYVPENQANKATGFSTLNNTLYPTTQAVANYAQQQNAMLTLLAALTDPGADRLLFWDESANALAFLALGTNLSITDTTLNAAGGGGGGATTALDNLASVAINTDLLPDSTQSLGSATKPFLASFTGTATQYLKTSQAANLLHLEALGSETNIEVKVTPKGNKDFRIVGAVRAADYGNDGNMAYGFTSSPNSGLWWQTSGGANGALLLRNNGSDRITIENSMISFAVVPKFAGTNTTGAGSAALGTNSPAVTNSAPYTWIQAKAADGSDVFIPAWK